MGNGHIPIVHNIWNEIRGPSGKHLPGRGDAIAIKLHGLQESQEIIYYYLLSTSLYHERKMNFHHGILQWVSSVLVVTLGMLDPKRVMFGWWLEFMATAPFPYWDRQAWGLWLLLVGD